MRNLKYAILGLVNRKPMTGYDIKKAFEDRALTSFWHAEHSQIYPELKKLVNEGMIRYDTSVNLQIENIFFRLPRTNGFFEPA